MTQPSSNQARSVGQTTAEWITQEVLPHEAALRAYLSRRFPSVETDDVVQESYLKLLKIQVAGRVALTKAYLYSVARNTALTLFRRRRIYSETPVDELPDWQVIADVADGAVTTEAHQRLELAAAAIDQLPRRCREICMLAAFESLPPAQIAERLGLSENTVYVQLARGVKKCAVYLEKRGERL